MPRDEDDYEDDRPRKRRRDDDEEEGDKPRRSGPPQSNNMAMIGLVMGVLSLFCFGLPGIFAILFGFLGLSKAKQTGTGKGMSIAAMGLGAFGVLLMIGSGIGAYFAYDFFKNKVGNARANTVFNNDMKQIGLGLHNYHDTMMYFPTADAQGVGGRPAPAELSQRLSWRANLLPYVEQATLFQRLQFDQPWNSTLNNQVTANAARPFTEVDQPTSNQTRIRVFVGPGALFEEPIRQPGAAKGANNNIPRQGSRITAITDGTSNTIMAVEAAQSVPWGQYNELPFDPKGNLPQLGKADSDKFLVLMADGSTRYIRKTVNPTVLKAAITRAGGEVVTLDP